jgi:hypothetical protein
MNKLQTKIFCFIVVYVDSSVLKTSVSISGAKFWKLFLIGFNEHSKEASK